MVGRAPEIEVVKTPTTVAEAPPSSLLIEGGQSVKVLPTMVPPPAPPVNDAANVGMANGVARGVPMAAATDEQAPMATRGSLGIQPCCRPS